MKPIARDAVALPMLGRVLLCALLVVGTAAQVASAQTQQELDATVKNMLDALQTKSLANFVADGDASFRAGMTQTMLDSVSTQFGPRLKAGYTATFLGRLNQQGYAVYLWKLEFKDGGDDRLITMAVRGGKVAGFYLK